MTIPGKGGRPRKWRSDADRSRAYRARQRGEEEPPTVEQAVEDGDELALARQMLDRLAGDLADRQREVDSLSDALRRSDLDVARLHNHVARLGTENEWLERKVAELRGRLAQVGHTTWHEPGNGAADPSTPPLPGLPPHVRRQLERERRRARPA